MKTLARAECRAEIVRRLQTVDAQSVRRWGRMSPHQMISHLIDSFGMMTGEVRVSDATGLVQQTLIKWLALYLPLAWRPGIPTRPEIDQLVTGRAPGDFLGDRALLQAMVETIGGRESPLERPTHPIFGPMSESAWQRWAYLHMDHHLRQFGA